MEWVTETHTHITRCQPKETKNRFKAKLMHYVNAEDRDNGEKKKRKLFCCSFYFLGEHSEMVEWCGARVFLSLYMWLLLDRLHLQTSFNWHTIFIVYSSYLMNSMVLIISWEMCAHTHTRTHFCTQIKMVFSISRLYRNSVHCVWVWKFIIHVATNACHRNCLHWMLLNRVCVLECCKLIILTLLTS